MRGLPAGALALMLALTLSALVGVLDWLTGFTSSSVKHVGIPLEFAERRFNVMNCPANCTKAENIHLESQMCSSRDKKTSKLMLVSTPKAGLLGRAQNSHFLSNWGPRWNLLICIEIGTAGNRPASCAYWKVRFVFEPILGKFASIICKGIFGKHQNTNTMRRLSMKSFPNTSFAVIVASLLSRLSPPKTRQTQDFCSVRQHTRLGYFLEIRVPTPRVSGYPLYRNHKERKTIDPICMEKGCASWDQEKIWIKHFVGNLKKWQPSRERINANLKLCGPIQWRYFNVEVGMRANTMAALQWKGERRKTSTSALKTFHWNAAIVLARTPTSPLKCRHCIGPRNNKIFK